MKKVFLFIFPAAAVLFALFCANPSSISSPAPSHGEKSPNDEMVLSSRVIEREKKTFGDEVDSYIERLAFQYKTPEIEISQSEIGEDGFAIIGLGDSLTLGTGSEETGGYLESIRTYYEERHDQVILVNHSMYGAQAEHLVKMLKEPILKSNIEKADVLFMTVGGNDLISVFNHNFTDLTLGDFTKGEENFKSDLRKIMSTIRLLNEDVQIYFIGIFNPVFESLANVKEFDEIITSWNVSTRNLLEMYPNTTFISIQHLFEDETNQYLAEDFFHPNEAGYKRIGEEIISTTEEILMVQRNPL
ncbi:MAG: GDSL-type esterase/lipase family protein [Bacillota bacterium]